MTYTEAIDYLFTATPVYQHVGGAAYKPGLATMQALDAYYGHPHRQYLTIHVGGTNGKGSTSHTLAAILQSSGYRVGLFTSPHLVDFRERIRVNGKMISQRYVCDFTDRCRSLVDQFNPSFFELSSMMALCYFAEQKVDVAIIEVGLGGRLDSTNIISPICSVITNISLDHTQYLGTTLAAIATEKAGIIKPNTPIVIGQARDISVRQVFTECASERSAPIIFAEDTELLHNAMRQSSGRLVYDTSYGIIEGALRGEAQVENTRTILATLSVIGQKLHISPEDIVRGFAEVTELTGLQGRWQILAHSPLLVCDTGHNAAGIATIVQQLEYESKDHQATHIVLGMASDKDVRSVLELFPKDRYRYYFTQASVARALPASELMALAQSIGLDGSIFSSVAEAVAAARAKASPEDLIFVGGSNFVVADLLLDLEGNPR